MLTKIKFKKFTSFEDLEVKLSPGINIFIGENGTGKTNILKAAYAACDVAKDNGDGDFAKKIVNVFRPVGKQIGRLVKRSQGNSEGNVEVEREIARGKRIKLRLSVSRAGKGQGATVSGSTKKWMGNRMKTAYIPVKDMMANAPGFSSLYNESEIHFEEIYADIVSKAYRPLKKGKVGEAESRLLGMLQKAMDGRVMTRGEVFYLRNRQGELEFTLLAEGLRKLGLLWVLIKKRHAAGWLGAVLGRAGDKPEPEVDENGR